MACAPTADQAGKSQQIAWPPRSSAPAKPSKTPTRSENRSDRSASRGDCTVRSGDTLSRIAAGHGTTWQQVYAANEAAIGADPNLIVPRQSLEI